jgi:hypothetical protein
MGEIVAQHLGPSLARANWNFALLRKRRRSAFAIAEVVVASTILILTVVTGTHALLKINRQAAMARVINAAKAEALSRIQQVTQCSYSPTATPPVIPSLLAIGTRNENIELGSASTDLGSIPGTATWTVTNVGSDILSVRCSVAYKYLGRDLSYELFTYKSPD